MRWQINLTLSLLLVCGCASTGHDEYLSSIKVKEEFLEPTEIFDISTYAIFQPCGFVKSGDFFCVADHGGKNHLTVINRKTRESRNFISKGRGPGEMVSVVMAPYLDGITLYDPSASRTLTYLDVQMSMRSGRAQLDTVCRFRDKVAFPVEVVCYDKGMVASVAGRKDLWYASFGISGDLVSCVKPPQYDILKEMDASLYFSLLIASHFTINPDGGRVCCVLPAAAAISFSSIDSLGELKEYRRYEMNPPEIVQVGSRTAFSKKSRFCFAPPASDRDNVYLLYSGKPFDNADSPNYECNHLIIYGWDGTPKRHIVLGESVMSIAVDGSVLYGLSSWPDSRILIYDLS